jgi:hypothetical protein
MKRMVDFLACHFEEMLVSDFFNYKTQVTRESGKGQVNTR